MAIAYRALLCSVYSAYTAEVESSRTSLASRTHFEVLGLEGQVLGLGLEASSPRKLACLRLEDSTIFWIAKILWSAWKIFWKTFFCGDRKKNFCEDLFFFWDRLKNFCEDLFFFFFGRSPKKFLWFWRALALVSLVLGLGLEHSCPWPRECLSLERLSLALASVFFCVLGLEPCVLDFTSDIQHKLYLWLATWFVSGNLTSSMQIFCLSMLRCYACGMFSTPPFLYFHVNGMLLRHNL